MKNKTFFYLASVALVIFTFFSCKKDQGETICDDSVVCYTQQPDSLYVKLKLSSNADSLPVEISFYKGYFDDGEKIDHFFTYNKEIYYLLPVQEHYAATAKYLDGQDTVVVIDGDKLGDGSYTNCDQSCYDWNDEMTLDLTLEK